LLGLLWGAIFPIARIGVEAGADPFLLVVLDLLLATAVMAPIALVTRTPRPPLRTAAESIGLGALLIGGINLPLYWGLRIATGGTASIVYATAPILSLVVLWVVGTSAAIHLRQAGALVVGLAGVVLLGFAATGSSLVAGLGALAAFGIGAACQGVGAVLVGRARPKGEDHWGLTFQFVGGATAALIALPFLSRSPALPLSVPTVGSIVYVGVFGVVTGYTLFFGMIHRFGAVRANQVTFLSPVVAVCAGVLVFGERFQPLEGAALVAIVIALALLQPSSKPAPTGPVSSDTRVSEAEVVS
jgi:drug/metabolite transporter (DMT)-like permease